MAVPLFYIRMILTRIQTKELIVFNVGLSAKKILNQNHARHGQFAFMITSKTVCIALSVLSCVN